MTVFDEKMAALRARFLTRAATERLAIMEAARTGGLAEVRRIAHGLAGAAGTFGFPELGTAALKVEEAEPDALQPLLSDLLVLLDQPR